MSMIDFSGFRLFAAAFFNAGEIKTAFMQSVTFAFLFPIDNSFVL